MEPVTIILIIIAVVVLWAIFAYNSFVSFVKRTEEAWADIDVQLKRRYNLIPNLIEAVKGYVAHEKETLQKVTEARTNAMGAGTMAERGQAENALAGSLMSLFAVAENYPDLKANQNFLDLQNELSDTENKIQAARRFYNTNVRDLNIKVDSFPSNLIANVFKFEKRDFFELAEGSEERKNIKVKF